MSGGAQIAAFTSEAALMSCAAAPDGITIVAGDASGGLTILRMEGTGRATLPNRHTLQSGGNSAAGIM